MDFTTVQPLRIHTQASPDECTACALAAIAEDSLKTPVDDNYIYQNSKDDEFGISASTAIASVIKHGVQTDSGVTNLFSGSKKIWNFSWLGFSFFDRLVKEMQTSGQSLFCGCYWQTGWDETTDGIVTMPKIWEWVAPHAFKVIGVKSIHDTPYLIVQNSRGANKGDNGLWYLPSQAVNKFSFAYKLTVMK